MQNIVNYLLNCISKVLILVGYPYSEHKATSTAESLEPESEVDGTKTRLDFLLK